MRLRRIPGLILLLPLMLGLVSLLLPGLTPVAFAHANLVRSEPAAGAALGTSPSNLKLWFSENLNPQLSRIRLMDGNQKPIPTSNAVVSSTDPKLITLAVPTLNRGTYVVLWQSVSAEDGHVLRGSFVFRIGPAASSATGQTVPQPTSNTAPVVSTGLDKLLVPTVLLYWLVWLSLTGWVGALLFELLVLQPTLARKDPDTATEVRIRFAQQAVRISVTALAVFLVAQTALVLLQAISATDGNVMDALRGPTLNGVLFSSSYGMFWLSKQGLALVAFVLSIGLLNAIGKGPQFEEAPTSGPGTVELARRPETISWLPQWQTRERICLGIGIVIMALQAASGHAAAIEFPHLSALAIDWLHLLANATWLGGIFIIALALLPALEYLPTSEKMSMLEATLNRFTPFALVAYGSLMFSGLFNSEVRITSLQQFTTTPYGLALTTKLLIIFTITAISAYHVVLLRPRLGIVQRTPATKGLSLTSGLRRLERLLHAEALLGTGILLCVALLNTLPPPAGASASNTGGGSVAASATATASPTTVLIQQHQVGTTSVSLTVTPSRFGVNTATVRLLNKKHQPIVGAYVRLKADSQVMDMGTGFYKGAQSNAGVYVANGVNLTMPGAWSVEVLFRLPGSNTLQHAPFTITAE